MRSDRDKRTDTEREIDDFLSKFEAPADELSADINSYIDDKDTADTSASQTFSWKRVDSPDLKNNRATAERPVYSSFAGKGTPKQADSATIIVSPVSASSAVKAAEESEADNLIEKNLSTEDTYIGTDEADELSGDDCPAEMAEESGAADEQAGSTEDSGDSDDQADLADKTDETDNTGKDGEKPLKDSQKKKKSKAKKKAPAKKKNSKALMQALFYKANKDYDPALGKSYVKDGKKIKNKP